MPEALRPACVVVVQRLLAFLADRQSLRRGTAAGVLHCLVLRGSETQPVASILEICSMAPSSPHVCMWCLQMAPRAKRKLEPTEWAELEHNVAGLQVEWKLTSSGIVHFKWDGSGKQTLTLANSEGADDAPRRVRARVESDPGAKAAAAAAKAAAKAAAEQAKHAQSVDYYIDGVRLWSDTCCACDRVQKPLGLALAHCPPCGYLFCNVQCERRGTCPHSALDDDEKADDEAARDVGCKCACCQSRSPPFCYDCSTIPCICAQVVGPGKRWIRPDRETYSDSPDRPTRFGGEELWNERYASWLARRGLDPMSAADPRYIERLRAKYSLSEL